MPTVHGLDGSAKGSASFGKAFKEPIRTDLIRRAVLAERSLLRQQYASDPMAGLRSSAHYHGLRHYRYTMMNREMARMPRIHGRVGYLHFTARVAPHTRKGRAAHPPKLRDWVEKINRKEWRKALRSALAATTRIELVQARGHTATVAPFIIEDRVQALAHASDVRALFAALKLDAELTRGAQTRIRGGKGARRSRPYRNRTGPLFIVSEDNGLGRACRNLPGVACVPLTKLTVNDLAPGGNPARLCLWSESALKAVDRFAVGSS